MSRLFSLKLASALTLSVALATGAMAQGRDVLASLPGRVSGVIGLGEAPQLILVEPDYGFANVRTLAIGEAYADGWVFSAATADTITFEKDGQTRRLNLPRRMEVAAAGAEPASAAAQIGQAAGRGAGAFGGLVLSNSNSNANAGPGGRGGQGRGGPGGREGPGGRFGQGQIAVITPGDIEAGAAAFAQGDFAALERMAQERGVDASLLQQMMGAQGGAIRVDQGMIQQMLGGQAGQGQILQQLMGQGEAFFGGRGGRGRR